MKTPLLLVSTLLISSSVAAKWVDVPTETPFITAAIGSDIASMDETVVFWQRHRFTMPEVSFTVLIQTYAECKGFSFKNLQVHEYPGTDMTAAPTRTVRDTSPLEIAMEGSPMFGAIAAACEQANPLKLEDIINTSGREDL